MRETNTYDESEKPSVLNRESSRRKAIPLVGLSLAGFFMYGCNNILMTLLPTYALSLGSTILEAGLQGTVFLLVAVAMRFYFGPLADRLGTRFVMVIGAASFVVSSVLLVFCATFWQLLLIRCIQAIGLSAFWPCAVAAVTYIAPENKRGLFIGIYRFATAASLLFGPLIALMLVDERGYPACFLFLAGLAMVAFVLSLFCAPSTSNQHRNEAHLLHEEKHLGTAKTLRMAFSSGQRSLVVLLWVTAITSLGYGLSMNFVVTFVETAHVPLNAGLFFSCFSIGGLIANPFIGWIVDKCNQRILLASTMTCMGVGIGLVVLVPFSPFVLLLAGFLAGTGSSGSTIAVLSTISARVDERFRASALAVQQNVVDLGIACASTLFGWLFAIAAAPDLVFAGQALFMIANALVLFAAKKTVRF